MKTDTYETNLHKTIKLDKLSNRIWLRQLPKRNMSKWVRDQLKQHFGDTLSQTEKKDVLKEEVAQINREYDQKVRSAHKIKVSLIEEAMGRLE